MTPSSNRSLTVIIQTFLLLSPASASLKNATQAGGIDHLITNSIQIKSESGDRSIGERLAIINHRGSLSTTSKIRFDDTQERWLIDGNVDLLSNQLRNFEIAKDTVLNDITIDGGSIENVKLRNVKFINPTLSVDTITVDDVTLTSLENNEKGVGTRRFVVSDDEGTLVGSKGIEESELDGIRVRNKITFEGDVDFGGNRVSNIHLQSGKISGDEIDIMAKTIEADSVKLLPFMTSKLHHDDKVLMIDTNGELKPSRLTLKNGWLSGVDLEGRVSCRDSSSGKQATFLKPNIEGGLLRDIESLDVKGESTFHGAISVHEDVMIDGSLMVGGSVLGSGPYVDVSDRRLKKNIRSIEKDKNIELLRQLNAVKYRLINELDDSIEEIGFIAQDVADLFPELVTKRTDGFLGVQYARFVPLLVESIKDLYSRLEILEEDNIDIPYKSEQRNQVPHERNTFWNDLRKPSDETVEDRWDKIFARNEQENEKPISNKFLPKKSRSFFDEERFVDEEGQVWTDYKEYREQMFISRKEDEWKNIRAQIDGHP